MKFQLVFGNNFCVYEDESCDEYQDLVNAFSDNDTGNPPSDVYEFTGLAFHQMQQCGGSLKINGRQIHAIDMSQTSGRPVGPDEDVTINLYQLFL